MYLSRASGLREDEAVTAGHGEELVDTAGLERTAETPPKYRRGHYKIKDIRNLLSTSWFSLATAQPVLTHTAILWSRGLPTVPPSAECRRHVQTESKSVRRRRRFHIVTIVDVGCRRCSRYLYYTYKVREKTEPNLTLYNEV